MLVLLLIETQYKINAIKKVRELTGWDLYEAKKAFEHGLIFADLVNMHEFMQRIVLEVDSQAIFKVKPFRKGGPQDATVLKF